MKQIAVPENLHKRLKGRADKEGLKLYGLTKHLVELGEEYEKILNRKVSPRDDEKDKEAQ